MMLWLLAALFLVVTILKGIAHRLKGVPDASFDASQKKAARPRLRLPVDMVPRRRRDGARRLTARTFRCAGAAIDPHSALGDDGLPICSGDFAGQRWRGPFMAHSRKERYSGS